jgi:hypothetical protein
MPTILLTVREYNDLRVRAAIAAHRATAARNGNAPNGAGEGGVGIPLQAPRNGPVPSPVESRSSITINRHWADPVTGGRAGRAGRPRLPVAEVRARTRARQRAYRARRSSRRTGAPR